MKVALPSCLALVLTTCPALSVNLHAQTGPSFELFQTNSSPSGAQSSADFNQDGKPDLLSTTNLALGNGDGTFQGPKSIGTTHGGLIDDVAVGDVNGDGHLDVVLVELLSGPNNTETSYVDIYYGNGDGTFQPVSSFTPINYPDSVAIGNFNGDGFLDLALGDNTGNVQIYLNQGGKSFVPGSSVKIGAPEDGVFMVRAGNLNGNGITALAATTNNSAYVLWGNGKGTFSPVLLGSYNVGLGSVGLTVGDLNQDGIDDVVVSYDCGTAPPAGHGPGTFCTDVEAYYGQGNQATFHRQALVDTENLSNNFYAADINGDGIADLVGGGLNTGEQTGMVVYLGHPDGSFDQNGRLFDGSAAGVPGDFNRDGKMDFGSLGDVSLNATPIAPCATSEINPTVTVCAPVNNTYLNSPFKVQATTYDETPVTALQEYLDGNLVYSQPVTNFNITESGVIGGHLLVTKAWDANGLSFRSDRSINVYSGTPGSTCAANLNTASICLPNGSTGSSPVHVVANASSAAVPTAVQLYVDNQLTIDNTQGSTTAIDTNLSLGTGSHYLVFKMFDASGASYSASTTVTVN